MWDFSLLFVSFFVFASNNLYSYSSFFQMEIPSRHIVLTYIAAQGPLEKTCGDFWQVKSELTNITMQPFVYPLKNVNNVWFDLSDGLGKGININNHVDHYDGKRTGKISCSVIVVYSIWSRKHDSVHVSVQCTVLCSGEGSGRAGQGGEDRSVIEKDSGWLVLGRLGWGEMRTGVMWWDWEVNSSRWRKNYRACPCPWSPLIWDMRKNLVKSSTIHSRKGGWEVKGSFLLLISFHLFLLGQVSSVLARGGWYLEIR